MFWNNFVKLCNKIGKSPNGVCAELGYSTAIASKWKKGATPRDTTLKKIADYFGIPVTALTEDSDAVGATPSSAKKVSPFLVTPENEKESRVLFAYRSHPEMQPAVDKLLGITDDGNVTLYAAAKSAENHKPEITQMPKDKWDTITTTSETEEDLL